MNELVPVLGAFLNTIRKCLRIFLFQLQEEWVYFDLWLDGTDHHDGEHGSKIMSYLITSHLKLVDKERLILMAGSLLYSLWVPNP